MDVCLARRRGLRCLSLQGGREGSISLFAYSPLLRVLFLVFLLEVNSVNTAVKKPNHVRESLQSLHPQVLANGVVYTFVGAIHRPSSESLPRTFFILGREADRDFVAFLIVMVSYCSKTIFIVSARIHE